MFLVRFECCSLYQFIQTKPNFKRSSQLLQNLDPEIHETHETPANVTKINFRKKNALLLEDEFIIT